ncbi:hypothetical protein QO002_005905 [Pararhizobium capsulatum DSM 1112]|uniref:Uncharacterized protein n=1 Tax=Pararhizobium capsulatum DSM 1112 TaxID=1121113 RepID=A0ABU0BZL1_9HYPH|nr:hypothetical protein [Pararhizobium capsulatum]MDQ0323698.1 hypothetical protein [Pararhizobium capsulatum DSM 1112]
MMDWFEQLTGFPETGYQETRARLEVVDGRLRSKVNGASYAAGKLELISLQDLRERAASRRGLPGRLRTRVVTGDVRSMHRAPENAGALFQVASQFNLLEMTGPEVTPEDGVTRYQHDHTQGPACAIAAGAATIYRNYFVPIDGGEGQTANRQLDGLAALGAALSAGTKLPVSDLWTMKNGYALCSERGLDAVTRHLRSLAPDEIDTLRGKLRIGVHSGVEATEAVGPNRPQVSQALCSALPVAYGVRSPFWELFASLVLEAAYEATLWAAVLNAHRDGSKVVFLTFLGGGVFGNSESWIHGAMRRAFRLTETFDLDVKLVSYGTPSKEILATAEEFP